MRPILLILGFIVLLRAPFLNQPIQGDDIYYLAGAEHAQIDPLHPNHARYVFLGETVDMRGHPHPPFNAWFLAALLALTGGIREVPYHADYMLFSAIAALSMWSLARRYTPRPLPATLLFVVTPAFVVCGTSLESDLTLLAFWMASAALFIEAADKRSGLLALTAALALLMAVMTGYQTVVLVPVLGFHLWRQYRNWKPGWAVLTAAPLALVC